MERLDDGFVAAVMDETGFERGGFFCAAQAAEECIVLSDTGSVYSGIQLVSPGGNDQIRIGAEPDLPDGILGGHLQEADFAEGLTPFKAIALVHDCDGKPLIFQKMGQRFTAMPGAEDHQFRSLGKIADIAAGRAAADHAQIAGQFEMEGKMDRLVHAGHGLTGQFLFQISAAAGAQGGAVLTDGHQGPFFARRRAVLGLHHDHGTGLSHPHFFFDESQDLSVHLPSLSSDTAFGIFVIKIPKNNYHFDYRPRCQFWEWKRKLLRNR